MEGRRPPGALRPLVIRDAQMRVLGQAMRRGFELRLRRYLEESYPSEVRALGPGALEELVEGGVDRAARHGITAEEDVARFVEMMVAEPPSFLERPRARVILEDAAIPGAGKVRLLWNDREAATAPDPASAPPARR